MDPTQGSEWGWRRHPPSAEPHECRAEENHDLRSLTHVLYLPEEHQRRWRPRPGPPGRPGPPARGAVARPPRAGCEVVGDQRQAQPLRRGPQPARRPDGRAAAPGAGSRSLADDALVAQNGGTSGPVTSWPPGGRGVHGVAGWLEARARRPVNEVKTTPAPTRAPSSGPPAGRARQPADQLTSPHDKTAARVRRLRRPGPYRGHPAPPVQRIAGADATTRPDAGLLRPACPDRRHHQLRRPGGAPARLPR
jgi:hypothetical protein